jgi:hypothetical protein
MNSPSGLVETERLFASQCASPPPRPSREVQNSRCLEGQAAYHVARPTILEKLAAFRARSTWGRPAASGARTILARP